MLVAPGVHRIDRVWGSNCYLVTGSELTLIDTGMPGQAGRTLSYLEWLRYEPQDLRRIVLTHHDIDHIGSAAELQRLTGAEICVHQAEVPYVQGRMARQPVWKSWLCTVARLEAPGIDRLLRGGEAIGDLEVVHTPGHTPGSISLSYRKVLFVGDLITWTPLFKGVPPFTTWDSRQSRASLGKIASSGFSLLLPGHGPPLEWETGLGKMRVARSWGVGPTV